VLRLVFALLVTVVGADIAVTLLVIPDGVYVWKPLPPFSACMTVQQHAWLERELDELARGVEQGMTRFDPELGWCTVAGQGTGPDAQPSYSYNALGARARREYAPQPPEHVVRLACFGDSFTHGDEVGDPDTWESQVEQLTPRIEALNFGVGGYGTDQALLRFRRVGLQGARVACLGLLVENIGRNVNRYRPFYWPPTPSCVAKPRFVLRQGQLELLPIPYRSRSELLSAVRGDRVAQDLARHEYWIDETRWTWIAPSSLARFAAGWLAYRRREPRRIYADRSGEPYRTTLELLIEFHRGTLERGAEASLVIVFPSRKELAACADGGPVFWQPLVDDVRARGVEVLDVTPLLLEAWESSNDEAGRAALFSGGHYSRLANGLVASALRAWVGRRFPPG